VTAASGAFGLFVAYGVAQVGSLFSADAWNNIGFTAAEVKNPNATLRSRWLLAPDRDHFVLLGESRLSLHASTCPNSERPGRPGCQRRAGGRFWTCRRRYHGRGDYHFHIWLQQRADLAGARVSYAMARDGLFFKSTGTLNEKGVPGSALIYQGIWITVLILLRTRRVSGLGEISYGNLYSDLLDTSSFGTPVLCPDDCRNFALRRKRPDADRPYKAPGYPFIPLLYIVAATATMFVLLLYQTQTAVAG